MGERSLGSPPVPRAGRRDRPAGDGEKPRSLRRGHAVARLRLVQSNAKARVFYDNRGWRALREFPHEHLPVTMIEMAKHLRHGRAEDSSTHRSGLLPRACRGYSPGRPEGHETGSEMADHVIPHFQNDAGVPIITVGVKRVHVRRRDAALRPPACLPRHGRRQREDLSLLLDALPVQAGRSAPPNPIRRGTSTASPPRPEAAPRPMPWASGRPSSSQEPGSAA